MRNVNKNKGELIIPKFIWHHTNIWVFSGTKCRPGELRCQGTPALRFPDNPTSSTGRLCCRIDRQSQAGPLRLPHLETQKLQTRTDWKMGRCWALKIQVKGFRINKRIFKDFLHKKSIKTKQNNSVIILIICESMK